MFFQKGNKVGDQYFGPKVRADLMSFINEKMGKISEEEKVSYLMKVRRNLEKERNMKKKRKKKMRKMKTQRMGK